MSKAGRPKKGSAGLPEWFDMRRYAMAKDFGAAEWFQQLSIRTFIKTWRSDEDTNDYIRAAVKEG